MKTKLPLILLVLALPFQTIIAQEYYWSNETKHFLDIDSKRVVLNLTENSVLEDSLKMIPSIEKMEQINDFSVLVSLKESDVEIDERITAIAPNGIRSFLNKEGERIIPTGQILFEPKKGVSIQEINKVCENQLKVLSEKYSNYTAIIKDYPKVFDIANKLYESGLVEYSHPDFIAPLLKFQNDPLYPDQYYLNNTGQFGGTPGIDINAPQAWGISTGLADIRVAVIDDGVENHPDMNGRVVSGYTAGVSSGTGAPLTAARHGQACAGIIAASRNNAEGIAGIAPCVEIVPINIFTLFTSASSIRDAIDWAWDEGDADVLSNSWGYQQSDAIAQAISRARSQGRNGKGSVVVFAAGNGGGAVSFPGNVSGVLTVGAIDRNGNLWAYSNRGPQIDLVAPTGNINETGDVRTTDRQGNNGYNNGNYVNTFGGTSAACPQVAGVAALMLSLEPSMSETQVKSRLTSSATGIGVNNNVGHGRLNAQAALQAVIPIISGPTKFCPSGVMKVATLPGGTITWSVSPSNALSFTQGGSTKTFTRIGSFQGVATITATLNPACGTTRTISKNVLVEPTIFMNITNAQPGSTMTISATATGGNAPYGWYINGVLQKTTSVPDVVIRYRCTDVGLSDLEVRSTTNCGLATAEDFFYDDCGSFRQMTVYPNPTSSEIFIAKNEDTDARSEIVSATSDGAISAEIFDFSGQILRSNNFERSSFIPRLDVSGLKKATYFLRIVGKEVDEVHQIIVE